MTENATTPEEASTAARLRALLRRFDPTLLGLLGLLSLPSYVVDSLAFLEVFSVFFLFFLWLFVGPLVDAVLARSADGGTEPTDWIGVGNAREYAVGYLMVPVTLLNPLVVTQDLLQFFGGIVSVVRHRGSLPDAASYDQAVPYRLPVEGTWTVVNGSPEREYSHSWIYPNQRYAYDLLITDEAGRSRPEGASTAVENYYCYDEPVLAPADGVVVDTFDTALEAPRGGGFSHPLKRSIPGGHVVIKHAESEYSFLAHLRPGSVAVEPGQRVERGQQVGRCGHSGNSSEPHLHFQIQDHPDFAMAASLPVQFDDVEIDSPGVAHDADLVPGYDAWYAGDPGDSSSGYHERTFIIEGQRVTDDRVADPDRAATTDVAGDRAPGDTVSSGAGVASAGRPLTSTLKRTAYSLAVAGVLAYVAALFAPTGVVLALLAGAGTVALAYRYVFLRGSASGRTGWLGTPVGFALGAAAVALATSPAGSGAGLGTGTVAGVLVLVGFLGYGAIGVAEWTRLRAAPGRPATR